MQQISKEDLKQIIKEAKEAGKDVSELEKSMDEMGKMRTINLPRAETKERETEEGTIVIESTGPAREDDFEWGN